MAALSLTLSPPLAVVAACGLTDPGPLTPEARRAQQRMSRAAFLAERALGKLLRAPALAALLAGDGADLSADPGPAPGDAARARLGYYLGVGGCGGDVAQFERIMAASARDGAWSQPAFNGAGLKACNPLYAFQLMHNFTLCHGAIAHGVGGPNAALLAHGAGAWMGLLEAAAAIEEGACEVAVVGGADDARHPVADPVAAPDAAAPGEGAALLALARQEALRPGVAPMAWLTDLWRVPAAALSAHPLWADASLRGGGELCLTWSPLRPPPAHHLDRAAALGDALAATPALLWVEAAQTFTGSAHTHTAHALYVAADGAAYGATFRAPPRPWG